MTDTTMPPRTPAPQFDDVDQQREAATTGMWVFLVSEMMFFGVLGFGYLVCRSQLPDAFAAASRHTDVVLGSVNTAVLLTSSLCMALAAHLHRAGVRRAAAWFLVATACLGILFLAIKGMEYRSEIHDGLLPGSDFRFEPVELARGAQIFWFLYFVMTGAHAVHLTIGIVLAFLGAWRIRPSTRSPVGTHWIEGAGLYWHFVDVIWIFLYPMLYLVARST